MFFTEHLLKKELGYFTVEQRQHIARACNDIINEKGSVAFGRAGKSGNIAGFASEKHEYATHVAIMIGLREMGIFEHEVEPTMVSKASEVEEMSKDDLIEQQARELSSLRGRFTERVSNGK